jgi:hypothetical protein
MSRLQKGALFFLEKLSFASALWTSEKDVPNVRDSLGTKLDAVVLVKKSALI